MIYVLYVAKIKEENQFTIYAPFVVRKQIQTHINVSIAKNISKLKFNFSLI